MRNVDERSLDLEGDTLEESLITSAGLSTSLQELRRRLAEPDPWPQRFRRLAEAIAVASNVICQECEELLDLYVDEELQGRPVQQMYLPVWQHLHACPCCREAHDLLADTLNLERRGKLHP